MPVSHETTLTAGVPLPPVTFAESASARIGMLATKEEPAGTAFNDRRTAYLVGSVERDAAVPARRVASRASGR